MLKGKTAVITGSGRGIGKSIALKLASHGANIVINDIPSSDYADETCEEVKKLGVECIVVKGDVRNLYRKLWINSVISTYLLITQALQETVL